MDLSSFSSENAQLLQYEFREVQKLVARDREVRAHEQAHAAVGGAYASHPHYQYVKGPNGVRYATSGHVNIDVSPVPGDPKATLDKMQTVARAAMAPAQPSAQDRAVAAQATQQAAVARAELAQQSSPNQESVQAEMAHTSGSFRFDATGSLLKISV